VQGARVLEMRSVLRVAQRGYSTGGASGPAYSTIITEKKPGKWALITINRPKVWSQVLVRRRLTN
jgi:hypothetical protein